MVEVPKKTTITLFFFFFLVRGFIKRSAIATKIIGSLYLLRRSHPPVSLASHTLVVAPDSLIILRLNTKENDKNFAY